MRAQMQMRVVAVERWKMDATTVKAEAVFPRVVGSKKVLFSPALPLVLAVKLVVKGKDVKLGDVVTVTVEIP